MNIPNSLTVFRVALIPIFVASFYMPIPYARLFAAFIFAVACVTDWLDGYLARRLSQTSELGAFLDPVADKLLVAIALVLLVSDAKLSYIALPAAIIVGREIVISALREWMAELGSRTSVAVNYIGKFKTAIQMVAIMLLLAYDSLSDLSLGILGYLLLYAAAGLTLWSMHVYLRAAWPNMPKVVIQKS